MPVHDWKRVDAGIFHHFHHSWIEEIQRALNSGLLPPDYYAMAEQHAAGFGPDVLTLQGGGNGNGDWHEPGNSNGGLMLAPPKMPVTAESDLEFYRRKQNRITVRHVSDDAVVAIVEVVSPGNKSSKSSLHAFVHKAAELLERRIHLLILDVHPPGARDPQGIHGAIWEEITDQPYVLPAGQQVTLAAYESDAGIRAYVQHVKIGERLIDMPLFLQWGGQHVSVPLEQTYLAGFAAMPRRWRVVLEKPESN